MTFGAAFSNNSADWMGGWTDGLLTVCKPREELTEMIDRFRAGGDHGKPVAVQLEVSWGRS